MAVEELPRSRAALQGTTPAGNRGVGPARHDDAARHGVRRVQNLRRVRVTVDEEGLSVDEVVIASAAVT